MSSFTGTLLPHQAAALPWLLDHPRALLADHVGLGKTVTAIAHLAQLRDRGELARSSGGGSVLIVAPSPLIRQWREHLETFLPGLTVQDSTEKLYANPTPKERLAQHKANPLGPDVELVGYEFLRSRITFLSQRRHVAVILDEVSAIKGRGKEHDAARQVARNARWVLGMSATPIEVDLMETWSILDAIGTPGLPSAKDWGDRYVIWQAGYQPQYGPYIDPKPIGIREDNRHEVRAYLDSVSLRRTQEDVALPLPAVHEQVWYAPLTAPQMHAMRMADNIQSDLRRYQQREQACSHVDGRSGKAELAVDSLLANPALQKVVLFAERLDHLDIVAGLLDAAGVGWVRVDGSSAKSDRHDAVDRFRSDPSVQVLLGSTVLERGLNLQNASCLISLGSTWNPAREEQRVGRLRRIGSPHTDVHHIVILTDTPHERGKWSVMQQRGDDGRAVFAA